MFYFLYSRIFTMSAYHLSFISVLHLNCFFNLNSRPCMSLESLAWCAACIFINGPVWAHWPGGFTLQAWRGVGSGEGAEQAKRGTEGGRRPGWWRPGWCPNLGRPTSYHTSQTDSELPGVSRAFFLVPPGPGNHHGHCRLKSGGHMTFCLSALL